MHRESACSVSWVILGLSCRCAKCIAPSRTDKLHPRDCGITNRIPWSFWHIWQVPDGLWVLQRDGITWSVHMIRDWYSRNEVLAIRTCFILESNVLYSSGVAALLNSLLTSVHACQSLRSERWARIGWRTSNGKSLRGLPIESHIYQFAPQSPPNHRTHIVQVKVRDFEALADVSLSHAPFDGSCASFLSEAYWNTRHRRSNWIVRSVTS